jgi:hypothetical protein
MRGKKLANEGSVDELYGYLVCAKPTSSKSLLSVYVWAPKEAEVTWPKADALARKIRKLLKEAK